MYSYAISAVDRNRLSYLVTKDCREAGLLSGLLFLPYFFLLSATIFSTLVLVSPFPYSTTVLLLGLFL